MPAFAGMKISEGFALSRHPSEGGNPQSHPGLGLFNGLPSVGDKDAILLVVEKQIECPDVKRPSANRD
jgi:hypothetical protein